MDRRQREEPGQVIRALRVALEMSQAEFARAAGWAPSTISSWERGRATPSRLAFKTILAFAEERGVRYRPTSAMRALVPMRAAAPDRQAAAATAEPRATFRPLLYPDRSAPLPDIEPNVASAAPSSAEHERGSTPRWHAEASFRLSLGTRANESRAMSRRLVELAIVALGFCAAFGLREPARWLLHGNAAPAASAAPVPAAGARALAVAEPVAPRLDNVATHAGVAGSHASEQTTAGVAAVAATDAPTARLESVLAIGAMVRATFRTDNDTVTVVPGEWIGGRLVVAIAADGVTLADRAGARHRVSVGQRTRFD